MRPFQKFIENANQITCYLCDEPLNRNTSKGMENIFSHTITNCNNEAHYFNDEIGSDLYFTKGMNHLKSEYKIHFSGENAITYGKEFVILGDELETEDQMIDLLKIIEMYR